MWNKKLLQTKLFDKKPAKPPIHERFKNFLATNPTSRRVRMIFGTAFSLLQKAFLVLILLLVVIFFALKFFKPQYLQKISDLIEKKISSSINLDNYDFTSINVSGNQRTDSQEVVAAIRQIQDQHHDENNSLIKKLTNELKDQFSWIEKINITRTLPNRLSVEIAEYQPFAIWQNAGQKFVINKDGAKIKIDDLGEFENLIILSGKDANLHANSLFNILSANPEMSEKVYSATWIGNRRWDVRFESGMLAKLPANNISDAWQALLKIMQTKGATKNLMVVDLRIGDKIYLEYSDNIIKEINNLKL